MGPVAKERPVGLVHIYGNVGHIYGKNPYIRLKVWDIPHKKTRGTKSVFRKELYIFTSPPVVHSNLVYMVPDMVPMPVTYGH